MLTFQFKQKPKEFTNPDKSLVIIGIGLDIMHGVKSSYWEFQKTLGKRSPLRREMETYLDKDDLWSNLEDSLGDGRKEKGFDRSTGAACRFPSIEPFLQ